jgi:prepilin-type N-terminal cleavage/methylation domain-containing protein
MRSLTPPDGFTLVEVLIASVILAAAVLSVAQLFAAATHATAAAQATSAGAIAAWQKVEQLRALIYARDDDGRPVSDTTTDTSGLRDRAGGTGLGVSPAGALTEDTAGYVDYLDALGLPLEGDGAALRARYRRRWSIAPAPGGVPDLVAVRVRVLAAGTGEEVAAVAALRARTSP